jgi:hypothetical protein
MSTPCLQIFAKVCMVMPSPSPIRPMMRFANTPGQAASARMSMSSMSINGKMTPKARQQ